MISVKDLSEDQVAALKQAVLEGAQLDALQKMLTKEWGFQVTFLDTRFLAIDLKLEFQDPNAKTEEANSDGLVGLDGALEEDTALLEQEGETSEPMSDVGGVNLTLDQVSRPGMMYSGKVVFSDGEKADWMIDDAGRPGIDPATADYQPAPEDVQLFQEELRKLLSQ